MEWTGRFLHSSHDDVPQLRLAAKAGAGSSVRLVGRSGRPVAELLSAVPGVLELEAIWPEVRLDVWWRYVALVADIRELEVRTQGVLIRRTREGSLVLRALQEATVWFALTQMWRPREAVQDEQIWRAAGRHHRAFLTERVAGLEVLAADGYREWTIRPRGDVEDLWLATLALLGRGRTRARVERPRGDLGLPGPDPYYVERFRISWEGSTVMVPPWPLPRSWHGYREQRLEVGDGATARWRTRYHRQEPPLHHVHIASHVGTQVRGLVRDVGSSLPLRDAWWTFGRAVSTPEAWYDEQVARGRAWLAAQPLSLSGEATSPERIWWRRWPLAGTNTWLASHPRWPEQALVLYRRGRGPYDDSITARWGLTGPSVTLPFCGGASAVLRSLAAAEPSLIPWWSQVSRSADVGRTGPRPEETTVLDAELVGPAGRSRKNTGSTYTGR